MSARHDDVKRQLLLQKAYAEGSFALVMHAAALEGAHRTTQEDEAEKKKGGGPTWTEEGALLEVR